MGAIMDTDNITNDITNDPGVRAQRAAEAHLVACWEAFHAYDELGVEEGEGPEDPSSAPFCGCETCVVREVLYAAWPILRDAALAGCQ